MKIPVKIPVLYLKGFQVLVTVCDQARVLVMAGHDGMEMSEIVIQAWNKKNCDVGVVGRLLVLMEVGLSVQV